MATHTLFGPVNRVCTCQQGFMQPLFIMRVKCYVAFLCVQAKKCSANLGIDVWGIPLAWGLLTASCRHSWVADPALQSARHAGMRRTSPVVDVWRSWLHGVERRLIRQNVREVDDVG